MLNREISRAWDYHNLTKHSYWSIRTSPHYLDWDNRPSPFKVYPEIEPIPLPRELIQSNVPALETIAQAGAKTDAAKKPTLEQLASVLYYSAGITREKIYPGGKTYFRAAACAGALYPIETYIVCSDIEGLDAGVYHFNPGDFALRRLRKGDYRNTVVKATAGEPQVAASEIILVYTAISWRSAWKYRDRSYRYHFWDNGTILANAFAQLAAQEIPAKLVMGFMESDMNRLVGIDGERELTLALLPIGVDRGSIPGSGVRQPMGELDFEVVPLSASEVDYQSIRDMHSASSFVEPSEVVEWREALIDRKMKEATGKVIALEPTPSDLLPTTAIESVIQNRASTRRFALKAIAYSELSVILDRATRAVEADFLHGKETGLNDIYLIANRVEGLEPGAYFYRKDERALELLKEGNFSERASYLTLEQGLGGDASATIFFMTDLKSVMDKLGNRGYRAAQMEAGLIGGRIYLAAYALGRGATGLTFYDDDVTEFFSPHAAAKSCIFVVSVGIPGKRPLY
jgi:SagB-type dehydrogenase family enzyme